MTFTDKRLEAIKREDTLQKIRICVSDENTDQHMETK